MNYKSSTTGRVLIAGAGTAGLSLAIDIKQRGGEVVGFLDDSKASSEILGTLSDVEEVLERYKVDTIFFAIPSASAELLRNFISGLDLTKIELAIIPRTYKIVAKEQVNIDDLTDLDVLDLVGRAPVKHELIRAKEMLRGKRVMVTGAAGSIGSRLIAQLSQLQASEIIGVDRTENGIFHLGRELTENDSIVSLLVADIQSQERMDQILSEYKPHYLFHAAAYKHVPLMQENPLEAINNNIWGTMNLMNLAGKHSVEKFVYVSTDKAVNPANVMGATKRVGELLLKEFAGKYPDTKFTGVRFGNVLQSEGSVMQIFRKQISNKQPLTVTHPDITRYFMTIDEASQLIIQAASVGNQADLFVLDMGDPIKVMDLAKGLIKATNPSLSIEVTGLRPGEKMYEELSYELSDIDHTSHPKIFVVKEPANQYDFSIIEWAETLVSLTRNYVISGSSGISKLKALGFPISE